MISSGMKRGLAATAVSALAMTGVPFMAGTANAVPLADQAGAADAVVLHAPDGIASVKNDGVNQTVHLVANGGSDVIQVRFEYSSDAGVTWNTISTVSRTNGAFSAEWTPPAAIYNLATVQVRAVALGSTATEIGTPDASPVTVAPGAEAIDIANAAGSAVGVFAQPYDDADTNSDVAGDQAAGDLGAVSGTTSDLSNDPDITVTSPSGAGAAQTEDYAEEVAAGDTVRDWSSKVDFAGYDWGTASDADQALVIAELGLGGDDAEAVTLYEQTITTVTATAASTSVQGAGTTSATVTVLDQNGKPVAGAQVVQEGGPTLYTNSRGQATFTGLTGSAAGTTHAFYVNTTDNNAYENGVDFRRTVTVTSYTAAATTATASSADGAAFDFDENDGDDIQVTVKDQNGAPMAGQTVSYYWEIDPFAAGVDNVRVPAAGPDSTATTGADGKANIAFPGGQPAGTYTLNYYVNQDGTPGQGAGDLSGTDLVVKAGNADIEWADGAEAQAAEGTTATFDAKLVLEDGTALAGRNVAITWNRTGNSVVAAQAAQPAGTTRTSDTTATATTGADGSFGVALTDPAPPAGGQADELNGDLVANTTATPNIGNANDSSTLNVDWLENMGPADAADIEVSMQNLIDGMATPGRPVDLDIRVVNVDGTELTDLPVEISVNHGFLSPNAESAADLEADPAPADGGLYGEWASIGTTKSFDTDDDGRTGAVVAIERDELFDTQNSVTTTVTIKAGNVTKTETVTFWSESPLNGGDLSIELDDEQSVTVLPKAPTTENVYYNVFVTDQFGNLVEDELVELEDNLPGAFMWSSWDGTEDDQNTVQSQLADQSPALELWSNVEGSQVVDGTWTTDVNIWEDGDAVTAGFQAARDNNSTAAETSEEITDTAAAVDWYMIDFAASVYTLENDAESPEPVGGTVIVTYTAVDQNGEPIEGLDVGFFRSGPDDYQDGDFNSFDTTDENGIAQYVFSGAEAGTATVEAIAAMGGDLIPQSRAATTVTFGGSIVESIVAKLGGKNNGAKDDVLKVNAPSKAAGATVKLWKFNKNGKKVLVGESVLNGKGNKKFTVADKNGKKFTKYVAKVLKTDDTKADTTNKKAVR